MENTQKPEAFVFIARGCKYTCISITTLNMLSKLKVDISIANESLHGWGYDAEDIKEELCALGIDYKQYRYRSEAYFNTKQLQSLIHLYLSLEDPYPSDDPARFI